MIIQGKNWQEIKKEAIFQEAEFRIDIFANSRNYCICYTTREDEREILLSIPNSIKPPYQIFFMNQMASGIYKINQRIEVKEYD